MTDFDPRDTVDIPDDRESDDNIPDAVCDVQTLLQRFYFTFGQAYNLRSNYVVVEAENRDAAVRLFMAERADCSQTIANPERCWAFDYTEAGFAGQPEQYGLTEVPIDATIWMER